MGQARRRGTYEERVRRAQQAEADRRRKALDDLHARMKTEREAWERMTPEERRMSQRRLDALNRYEARRRAELASMMVILNGVYAR